MKYLKFILIVAFLVMPLIASGEYKSIDDLAKAYSDETCKTCHQKFMMNGNPLITLNQ
jgi:hypothetical protein